MSMAEIFARLIELLSSVWSYPIQWDDVLFVVVLVVLGAVIGAAILAIVFGIYNFILDVFRSWLTPRVTPILPISCSTPAELSILHISSSSPISLPICMA